MCVAAEERSTQEYQVKAVFLFNFTQFVDWPPESFSGVDQPIVIGVLGDDPFGTYLDETVRGEKVNDRPLIIRRFRYGDDVGACHVLFISQSETSRLDQIIAGLHGRSILTVSDIPAFGRRGGMIRFVTENSRVKLRINADAAKAAGLTLSSKLLRIADIVSAGTE
ncbi:MAG TPA: YfiR family protein [Rudaea sp.]